MKQITSSGFVAIRKAGEKEYMDLSTFSSDFRLASGKTNELKKSFDNLPPNLLNMVDPVIGVAQVKLTVVNMYDSNMEE